MEIISRVVFFCFTISSQALLLDAQQLIPNVGNNTLTQAEFNAVEINGVTFQDLAQTNGTLSKMRDLFGADLTYEYVNDDPVIYKNFGNAHLSIVFNSDDNDYFYPSYIRFTSNSARLVIQGKTIRIGNNKSALGSGLAVNQDYGGFVFVDESTGSSSWGIVIENDIIVKIEFNSY